MAFMVLAFSILPCADDASFETGETKYELAQSIPLDNGTDHEDACSPFCICSCCAGFSVVNRLPALSALIVLYQSSHSSYISEELFSIAKPIWQPPRLV